jgi:hypothetical protein
VSEESRDQSKLPGLRNKRNVHHRAQILRGVKVEPHGDKEFLQIYLNESQMEVRSVL